MANKRTYLFRCKLGLKYMYTITLRAFYSMFNFTAAFLPTKY